MVFLIIPSRGDLCQHLEGGSGKQGPDGFLGISACHVTDDKKPPVFGFHPWLPWWYFMVAIHGNLTGNHERTHASSKHPKKGGFGTWWFCWLELSVVHEGMARWATSKRLWINIGSTNDTCGRKGLDLDYSPWIVVGLLSKWGRLYPYLSGPNFATRIPHVEPSLQSHSREKQQGQEWIAHKTFQNGSPYFLHTQDIYCIYICRGCMRLYCFVTCSRFYDSVIPSRTNQKKQQNSIIDHNIS